MGYIKELTLRGTKGFDRFMRDRLHWRLSTRSLVFYYLGQFQEQVLAVVPVTLCLVITLAIYFGRTVENPGKLTGGLLSAMFGLVLFVDGLRVAIINRASPRPSSLTPRPCPRHSRTWRTPSATGRCGAGGPRGGLRPHRRRWLERQTAHL